MTSPISDILKDLANESWREGHNEEPGNEVGYWIKEAEQALTALLEAELNKAAERYDYTEGVEVAYDVIDSVKKALGIPTELTK